MATKLNLPDNPNDLLYVKKYMHLLCPMEVYCGYRDDYLAQNLTKMEQTLVVCKRCNGIMREPSFMEGETTCSVCSNNPNKPNLVKELKSSINILEIKCPTLRDCQWKGQLLEVEIHLTDCLHFLVKCKECNQIFPRGELKYHEVYSCPSREVNCNFCDKRGIYNNLERHLQMCLKQPLLCPNKCGAEFTRDKSFEHKSKCELEEITCPYTQYGCNAKPMLRRDLLAHEKEYIVEHTNMSLVEIKQLREINTRLEENQNELIWKVKGMKELDGVDWEIKNLDKLRKNTEIEGPTFYVNKYKLKIYFTYETWFLGNSICFHLNRIEGEFDRNLGESSLKHYRIILVNETDYNKSHFRDGPMCYQLKIGKSSNQIDIHQCSFQQYLTANNSLFLRLYFDSNIATPLKSLKYKETAKSIKKSVAFLIPDSFV